MRMCCVARSATLALYIQARVGAERDSGEDSVATTLHMFRSTFLSPQNASHLLLGSSGWFLERKFQIKACRGNNVRLVYQQERRGKEHFPQGTSWQWLKCGENLSK